MHDTQRSAKFEGTLFIKLHNTGVMISTHFTEARQGMIHTPVLIQCFSDRWRF